MNELSSLNGVDPKTLPAGLSGVEPNALPEAFDEKAVSAEPDPNAPPVPNALPVPASLPPLPKTLDPVLLVLLPAREANPP